jgi:hypothetical protein
VPTPFYHLDIAFTLLDDPELQEPELKWLNQHQGAFLLGHTAPDVQVISGEAREKTHFFSLPILETDELPWSVLLASWPPTPPKPGFQPTSQAAFIAGYICHLQADYYWVKQIYSPIFGPRPRWGTLAERAFRHNVLRAYQDQRVHSLLPAHTAGCLEQLHLDHWLPFIKVQHLDQWRNFVAGQLKPGASSRTIEVFAARQALPMSEFTALLESEQRMEKEIFSHISRRELEIFRQSLIVENIRLLKLSAHLFTSAPALRREP